MMKWKCLNLMIRHSPPMCYDLYVIRHLLHSLTSLLFGPMICLECSHMISTNQSQSDVKFVTEEKGGKQNGTVSV